MTYTLLCISVFLMTYLGTTAFRRWSLGRGVLDIPNERSSHVDPTPRGGGIIFVAVTLGAYAILALTTEVLPWSYLISGLLVAGISWLDDLRSISFAWRLVVHFLAAGILIADSMTAYSIGSAIATGIAVMWIVWMINGYNFMDGIDGIASLQAIVAALSWLVLSTVSGHWAVALYAAILASCVLGFLLHNWQPAKVFMGDVGSAFLGFTLASFPFLIPGRGSQELDMFFLAGVIFVWFFVFDTLFTLFRRLVKGEKVWQAHRSHLYQRMVIGGMQHSTVTLIYGAFAAVLSALFIFASETTAASAYIGWIGATVALLVALSAALIFISRRTSRITV